MRIFAAALLLALVIFWPRPSVADNFEMQTADEPSCPESAPEGSQCDCTAPDSHGAKLGVHARPSDRLWSPVTPNGVVTYERGPLGVRWFSPLWVIRSNAKYYPGNYAKPYDYREVFDYPWNGPRPAAPMPPPIAQSIEPSMAPGDVPRESPFEQLPDPTISATPHGASVPQNAWPTATAAQYTRQLR